MCASKLACAVAYPEEMGGGGIVATWWVGSGGRLVGFRYRLGGVTAESGEALFIVKHQAFMAGIDVHSFDSAVCVEACRSHET